MTNTLSFLSFIIRKYC